jgi:hypothetical protein
MAEDNEWEPIWLIVQVATLPFPFHLFRCQFEQEHLHALRRAGADPDEGPSPEQCATAFELFLTDIGSAVSACPYHEPDWNLATERAVQAVRPDGSHAEIKLAGLDEGTQRAAFDLFAEPIFLNGDRLGNGQHRTCAMKSSGVSSVPIEDFRRRRRLT